jgi:hypothetical protein
MTGTALAGNVVICHFCTEVRDGENHILPPDPDKI